MSQDTIHVEPREVSELELHAAIQAATYPQRELPAPLWPGHVLDEVKAVEPACAAYRADKLRREAAEITGYGAGLTERDVSGRRDQEGRSFGFWVAFALGGIVSGAFALIVFARDLITAAGVR